jgi:hypothetical protein
MTILTKLAFLGYILGGFQCTENAVDCTTKHFKCSKISPSVIPQIPVKIRQKRGPGEISAKGTGRKQKLEKGRKRGSKE